MKRKMFRVKALQFMERIEKSQAVLAAGDTDSNMVLIIDESSKGSGRSGSVC